MVISNFAALLVFLVGAVLVLALPIAVGWLLFKIISALVWLIWRGAKGLATGVGYGFKGVGLTLGHVCTFVKNTVVDSLRFVGALVTTVFMVPPIVGSVFLGRWSSANHYGKALSGELREAGVRLYRVVIGNPVRLLGLRALTEGVEERLPAALAHAPGPDRPTGGARRFVGYKVVGSLPRGGSGARLYLAEPTGEKRDGFARAGLTCPARVVIKSFSLEEGSTLPQIVRESRALSAAKDLGLVLDHSIEGEDFWYVMPFVEGSDLGEVTREVHRLSGDEGLSARALQDVLSTTTQLLATLDQFHSAGMWHKDIKPANIIVSKDGRAHLVDFGLVTPLRSAMTLTTHGTEYFRDPEMVRLAMQGVKVHEVDGVKFDLYSMGAVLFSMIENSFPAHGSLSQITKRCPETLRWIVRRAMADTRQRYGSAREMLADVVTVMESPDAFAISPADLPSFREGASLANAVDPADYAAVPTAGEPSNPLPADIPPVEPPRKRRRRKVHLAVVGAAAMFVALVGASIVASVEYAQQSYHRSQRHQVASTDDHASFGQLGHDLFAGAHAAARDARDHAPEIADEVRSGARSIGQRLRRLVQDARTDARQWLEERDELEHHHHPAEPFLTPSVTPFDVLVVNDLPPSADPELLVALQEVLSEAEMSPRGLSAKDEREVDWLAEARRAAGVGFPEGPDAITRIQTFLAHDEVLDAVCWLAPGEKEGEVRYRFVTLGELLANGAR